MEPERIIQHLKACRPATLAECPVLLAYAYGSVVEGCPTLTSDVDIALVLQPSATLTPYERLQLELDVDQTV